MFCLFCKILTFPSLSQNPSWDKAEPGRFLEPFSYLFSDGLWQFSSHACPSPPGLGRGALPLRGGNGQWPWTLSEGRGASFGEQGARSGRSHLGSAGSAHCVPRPHAHAASFSSLHSLEVGITDPLAMRKLKLSNLLHYWLSPRPFNCNLLIPGLILP